MTSAALPSSDAELVQQALQGQKDAFGELYNRYFSPVYDFLHRMMRNGEEAADLTQETFLRAMQNLSGLQKAASFKSWLFTIAHRQALNRLERQQRIATPPVGPAGEEDEVFDPVLSQVDHDRLANPEQAVEAEELSSLVWEAAESLDQRQYAVLDLHVRQGLESAEIAEVLGVSKGNAYTMVNRMKQAVEDAIGAFLLARRGSKDCPELRQVIAPFDIPPVSPELRRAIDRHVRDCDVCTRTRRRLLSPVEILGAMAAVPAPVGLQGEIWGVLGPRWAEAAEAVGEGAGEEEGAASEEAGGAGDGEPPIAGQAAAGEGWFGGRWDTRRLVLFIGAMAALAVIPAAVLLSLVLSASDGSSPSVVVSPTGTAVTETPTVTATVTATATPTAAPTETVLPTGTATEESPPTAPPAQPTPVPPDTPTPRPSRDTRPPTITSVSTDAQEGYIFSGNCDPYYYSPQQVTITARVIDNTRVASVKLYYELSGANQSQVPMIGGPQYSTTIGPFYSGAVLGFWVEATDAAGNRSRSQTAYLNIEDCGLR